MRQLRPILVLPLRPVPFRALPLVPRPGPLDRAHSAKAGPAMSAEPTEEIRSYCERCEVWITFENAADHPNGLGGHALSRWVVSPR